MIEIRNSKTAAIEKSVLGSRFFLLSALLEHQKSCLRAELNYTKQAYSFLSEDPEWFDTKRSKKYIRLSFFALSADSSSVLLQLEKKLHIWLPVAIRYRPTMLLGESLDNNASLALNAENIYFPDGQKIFNVASYMYTSDVGKTEKENESTEFWYDISFLIQLTQPHTPTDNQRWFRLDELISCEEANIDLPLRRMAQKVYSQES